VEFSEAVKPYVKHAKICVTGGFRTLKGMEQALQDKATDIIGLARPLTAEPYLIKEMLEGKKTAAAENKVPLPVTTYTSVLQIGAIAKGVPIPDLSTEEGAAAAIAAATGKKPEEKPLGLQQNTEASYEKGN
ncbi:hypothetical protein JCM8097_002750, partial [Rhodosporidiobolus ruineniae]